MNLIPRSVSLVFSTSYMDAYPVSDWYEPRDEAVKIMNNAEPFELLVVHGTWCPDCEYTIPLLKKLLQ